MADKNKNRVGTSDSNIDSRSTYDIGTHVMFRHIWGRHQMETFGHLCGEFTGLRWIPLTKATLTLSQCTLAGAVYTGMPLECHWLTQCTLGYHWATQRILAGYTGPPLEKLSWNIPTLECHWRNLVQLGPHWDATGESLTFAAYTGTPLRGLWQPTHALTHIVKHAE